MSIFSPFSEGNGKIPHKSPIPSKRTQLFLHVLSEKWTSIIGLSLAYSLVLSPEILWMFVHLLFLERQASSATLFSAGQLLLFASVLVILSIISGPGLAVLARWSRDLARFRPLSPRHFVCQALKTCWKEGLILSFFSALLPILAVFAWIYLGAFQIGLLRTLLGAGLCLFFLLLFLLSPSLWSMAVTYQLSFSSMLVNANYMTLRQFGKAVFIRFLSILPELFSILLCLSNALSFDLVCSALLAYYMFFGFGFRSILLASFGSFLCETYLNPRIPGAGIDIGLASERVTPRDV